MTCEVHGEKKTCNSFFSHIPRRFHSRWIIQRFLVFDISYAYNSIWIWEKVFFLIRNFPSSHGSCASIASAFFFEINPQYILNQSEQGCSMGCEKKKDFGNWLIFNQKLQNHSEKFDVSECAVAAKVTLKATMFALSASPQNWKNLSHKSAKIDKKYCHSRIQYHIATSVIIKFKN